MIDNFIIIFVAILIDIFFGWPNSILIKIGHPIIWIGKVIKKLDIILNKKKFSDNLKIINGYLILLICTVIFTYVAFLVDNFLIHQNMA